MQKFSPIRAIKALFLLSLFCFSAFAQSSDTVATTNENAPVDYGFVIDNSGSFRLLLDSTIKLVKETIAKNADADRVFFVHFSASDRVILEQELTNVKGNISDAADAMYAEAGQKAIVDAVDFSAKYLSENSLEGHRKVLVLITDGDERSSVTKPEAAIQKLKDGKIKLIVIGIADGFKIDASLLEKITKESGGSLILPKNQAELKALAPQLAAEIHKP